MCFRRAWINFESLRRRRARLRHELRVRLAAVCGEDGVPFCNSGIRRRIRSAFRGSLLEILNRLLQVSRRPLIEKIEPLQIKVVTLETLRRCRLASGFLAAVEGEPNLFRDLMGNLALKRKQIF